MAVATLLPSIPLLRRTASSVQSVQLCCDHSSSTQALLHAVRWFQPLPPLQITISYSLNRPSLQAGTADLRAARSLVQQAAALLQSYGHTVTQKFSEQHSPTAAQKLGPRSPDFVMLVGNDSPLDRPAPSSALALVRTINKPLLLETFPLPLSPTAHPCVVAAVSLSKNSGQVVDQASALADLLGLPLTVLHVVDPQHTSSQPDFLMGPQFICESLRSRGSHGNTSCAVELTTESLAKGLAHKARSLGASFLVLGVDSAGRTSDLLEDSIMRSAPCAIALVPIQHPAASNHHA